MSSCCCWVVVSLALRRKDEMAGLQGGCDSGRLQGGIDRVLKCRARGGSGQTTVCWPAVFPIK